jgi:hypothetical protein
MTAAELREREVFVIAAAVLMRDRLLMFEDLPDSTVEETVTDPPALLALFGSQIAASAGWGARPEEMVDSGPASVVKSIFNIAWPWTPAPAAPLPSSA